MAFLNDLKKLLFGATAVTKSATEKAVDATKEASSELWDKMQTTSADIGKSVAEKTELAMDKAGDFAMAAKEKASDFVNDLTGSTPPPMEPATDDEVMDAILAEREAAPTPPLTKFDEAEDTLELPPLNVSAESPKLLDDGIPDNDVNETQLKDEPDFLASLKNTATAAGATVMEKGGEAMDKAGDFASGVGQKVMETGSKLGEKFGETAENVGEAIFEKGGAAMEKAGDFASGVGKKVMETGSKLSEKFGETAENVGEAIYEKGGETLDRAKELAAGLGAKIVQAKDDLFAKAQAEADKSGETPSSLIDKAKELNQKLEDKISGNNTKFADTTLNTSGSEFAKHDNFWEKADRFSKGDYQMKGDQLKPGEVKISEVPDPKPDEKRTDDLIDDAIVES